MVNIGFWLAISGLSLIVLTAVLAITLKDQSIAAAIEAQARQPADKRLTPEEVRRAVNLGVWLNLGFAVALGLLAAYFVRQVRAGDRKARTRYTIIAVLLMLLLFLFGAPLLALAGLLCVLAAVGLLFSASATRFLNEQ